MKTRLSAFAVLVALALAVGLVPAARGASAAGADHAPAARQAPPQPSARQPCGVQRLPHRYRHVIWIWMENHSYTAIIGNARAPYLNALAARCGLATNYHNISHPSLPNYVAATSGLGYRALRRFTRDCDPVRGCTTPARSIFSQGESWRAYEESMPSACHGTNGGEYAVRHNPPPYFTALKGCSSFDRRYARLGPDLAAGRLPAFSFITPNLIDDMHDGTIAEGDRWLSRHLPAILNSPQYRNGSTAVFVTWDEGEGGTATACAANTTDVGCRVATIVISPTTPKGTRSRALFNHYSLLGTAERLLGLPRLGKAAAFPAMIAAFRL